MNNRILDLSDSPARLYARGGLLHVHRPGQSLRTIPFGQISVLVCSHPQVTFTQAVVAELAAVNGLLIACDSKSQPVAMLLPLVSHFAQTARFQLQAAASLPLRKRLWRSIVASKIRAQGRTLAALTGTDCGLERAAGRLRIAEATQAESTASRMYWPRLFCDPDYRRSNADDPRNHLLNYGYSIVRAASARALCASGLHPALPLHHHNQYDPYPLANDLMEPFRPLVDRWCVAWWRAHSSGISRDAKQSVLRFLTGRFSDGREARSLFDWIQRASNQLARCLEGNQNNIGFPALEPVCDETAEGEAETAPQ